MIPQLASLFSPGLAPKRLPPAWMWSQLRKEPSLVPTLPLHRQMNRKMEPEQPPNFDGTLTRYSTASLRSNAAKNPSLLPGNRLVLVNWAWDGYLVFCWGSWRMRCPWFFAAVVARRFRQLQLMWLDGWISPKGQWKVDWHEMWNEYEAPRVERLRQRVP